MACGQSGVFDKGGGSYACLHRAGFWPARCSATWAAARVPLSNPLRFRPPSRLVSNSSCQPPGSPSKSADIWLYYFETAGARAGTKVPQDRRPTSPAHGPSLSRTPTSRGWLQLARCGATSAGVVWTPERRLNAMLRRSAASQGLSGRQGQRPLALGKGAMRVLSSRFGRIASAGQ